MASIEVRGVHQHECVAEKVRLAVQAEMRQVASIVIDDSCSRVTSCTKSRHNQEEASNN